MPQAKDCHALTTYFIQGYEKKYGKKPSVNRNTARWGFDSILHDKSIMDTKFLIDYYFTTPDTKKHDLDWFFYNYDKLWNAMEEAHEDAQHRKKLMEESKKRAEAWRQSGRQGIANS
jgi:hypothetical protein